MRSVLLAILVASAGCHGGKASGPAWPAPSTTADDGGESLAPHSPSEAAAVEKSAEPDDEDDAPAVDAAKPAAASDDKATPSIVQPTAPDDEPIMTEEIIIEVDD